DRFAAQRIDRPRRVDGQPADLFEIGVEAPVLRVCCLWGDHLGSSELAWLVAILFKCTGLLPPLDGAGGASEHLQRYNCYLYSAATRGGVCLSTSLSKSSTMTTRSVASSAPRMIPASLSFRTPASTASTKGSRSRRRSIMPLRAARMNLVSISSASVTLIRASSSTPVTSLGSLVT